jgi:hypothetical protein
VFTLLYGLAAICVSVAMGVFHHGTNSFRRY